jgi:hypothetical protein
VLWPRNKDGHAVESKVRNLRSASSSHRVLDCSRKPIAVGVTIAFMGSHGCTWCTIPTKHATIGGFHTAYGVLRPRTTLSSYNERGHATVNQNAEASTWSIKVPPVPRHGFPKRAMAKSGMAFLTARKFHSLPCAIFTQPTEYEDTKCAVRGETGYRRHLAQMGSQLMHVCSADD